LVLGLIGGHEAFPVFREDALPEVEFREGPVGHHAGRVLPALGREGHYKFQAAQAAKKRQNPAISAISISSLTGPSNNPAISSLSLLCLRLISKKRPEGQEETSFSADFSSG
jgi:hypothetical protein